MTDQFYAYLWLREDGTPYYAGKGKGDRAFIPHRRGFKLVSPQDKSRILVMNRATEREAFGTEMELIRNWGRKDKGTGCLHNMTDGGDGPSGYRHTQKARASMSAKRIGNKNSLGCVRSPDFSAKQSRAHKGVRWSAEIIAQRVASRRANGNYGMSKESREKESLTKFLKTVAWG